VLGSPSKNETEPHEEQQHRSEDGGDQCRSPDGVSHPLRIPAEGPEEEVHEPDGQAMAEMPQIGEDAATWHLRIDGVLPGESLD
jgi:hypothetical protein